MPIEGISAATQPSFHGLAHENVGLNNFLASLDVKTVIKKIEDNSPIEDEYVENQKQQQESAKEGEEKESERDDSNELREKLQSLNIVEGENKFFDLQYNTESGQIVIINTKTKSFIKSLSPEELIKLINKLNYSGGVFIDKHV